MILDDIRRGTGVSDLTIRLRRWLYYTLEPLDKGDFRWEFLVPFNNKTLTSTDKFIVCSAFIGLSFTLQTLYDPGASVGVHLSYIAQFFSYAMGDPIGFRLLAVLTSVLEIGGNLFETKQNGAIVNGADFNIINALNSVDAEDVFPIFYDQVRGGRGWEEDEGRAHPRSLCRMRSLCRLRSLTRLRSLLGSSSSSSTATTSSDGSSRGRRSWPRSSGAPTRSRSTPTASRRSASVAPSSRGCCASRPLSARGTTRRTCSPRR